MEFFMDNTRNQQGTTLVEVLISMVIVAITTVGGIALFYNSSEMQKMAFHKGMALELANSKMEEARAAGCAGLVNEGPDNIPIGELTFTYQKTVIDPCEAQVRVSWNEFGQITRDLQVDLKTYIR